MGSRVVFLIENFSFPRDRRVRQEAAALAEAGWQVSVVCPRGSQDKADFEVINGVKVYRYRQPWQGDSVLGYILEYSWALLFSFLLIMKILIRDGFDVLHAANPPDLFFLVAAPFRLFGKKFVYDLHDLSPELFAFKFGKRNLLGGLLRFAERCSFRMADMVIVTNQSGYDLALQRGRVNPDKICVVRNGPDLQGFRKVTPRPELKQSAKYLVVYVGVISEQDGVDAVVRAARHIVHERGCKDVRFAILGDGSHLEELRALAGHLRVEEYITFTGWVGDADVLSYLSTADVCLAPDPPDAFNQLSTFIKIMEYMSCEKVTVSFDLLESRRTAGPTGIYVPNFDPASYGDAILEILRDPSRREQLGRIALERVQSYLHWGVSREVLTEAYEEVIRRGMPVSRRPTFDYDVNEPEVEAV